MQHGSGPVLAHQNIVFTLSAPFKQFAVVFAALIHDADHPGCPNATLVREQTLLAVKYQNKSVAEQNSLDLCWRLLKSSTYRDLRSCIYTNEDEMKRFRQVRVLGSCYRTTYILSDREKPDNDISLPRFSL